MHDLCRLRVSFVRYLTQFFHHAINHTSRIAIGHNTIGPFHAGYIWRYRYRHWNMSWYINSITFGGHKARFQIECCVKTIKSILWFYPYADFFQCIIKSLPGCIGSTFISVPRCANTRGFVSLTVIIILPELSAVSTYVGWWILRHRPYTVKMAFTLHMYIDNIWVFCYGSSDQLCPLWFWWIIPSLRIYIETDFEKILYSFQVIHHDTLKP